MFKVLGFYKFIKVTSLKKNKDAMQKFFIKNNIRGTIIIAKEGLNGTISGQVKDIEKTIKKLKLKNISNKIPDEVYKSIFNSVRKNKFIVTLDLTSFFNECSISAFLFFSDFFCY